MLISDFKKKINILNLNFLIAYSGGLDSTVLLYQFVKLRELYNCNLRALYIHHGYNINADSWLIHCQQQCNNWKVPFIYKHLKIEKKNNFEANARKKRYNIFLKYLEKNEILLTGHHMDDQCETFLLALKRGSGPLGLSSMPKKRYIGKYNQLIRPLLNISKVKIKQWAIKNKLSWIEDQSNFDVHFDRNYLRNKILPLFIKRWPSFNKTVYRSAELCRDQENIINDLLVPYLKKIIQNDDSIIIKDLEKFSIPLRNILLRKWIIIKTKNIPSKDFIKRIWKEIVKSKINRKPQLKISNYNIKRYKKKIYIIPNSLSLTDITISWNKPWRKITLPQNIGYIELNNQGIEIRKPLLTEKVTICFFSKNKKIYLSNKKMKKLWNKFVIPPWDRNKIPMIFYDKQLITIMGIIITKQGLCKKNLGWHVLWKKN